jgi:Nickel responsive protein SCO4226-like
MPKYVIERNMPGVGTLSASELNAASKVSNEALATLSPRVKWQQSYVTDDKIFCVYLADDPEAIREHARLAGFPADSIHLVGAVIDPSTGDVAA